MPTDDEVAQMAEYCFAIKKLKTMCGAAVVTHKELADAEKFYRQTINRNMTGSLATGSASNWFLESMQQINQRLDGINQSIAGINQSITGINQKFTSSENRSLTRTVNARAQLPDHTIEAPVNDNGIMPAQANSPIPFPATVQELENLNAMTINQLLQFYGQSTVGNVATRRFRLKKYLGCL
jgi:hypothetical protein